MASVFKRKGKGNYIIRWFDAEGRLREKSSRMTDRRKALWMASQIAHGVALRRAGVIDPRQDQFAQANARPLQEHVDAYLVHLEHGNSPRTVADARAHMAWMIGHCNAKRLGDLTLEAVERALKILKEEKKAARTINHRGGSVRAFLGWCVNTNRLDSNPLRFLPQLDEESDRRRTRRALSIEEIGSLFAVAEQRGRKLWYQLALYAGLRLSDLKRLRWGDVDLDRGVLIVRHSKAKRGPIELTLHELLRAELTRQRPALVLPTAAVFPSAPTNETRRKDFRRAGIAEKDESDRYADLHALRTTLGTMLAQQGATPQVAQRIMRHSKYATTLKFYTKLGLVDSQEALARLPVPEATKLDPHRNPHQSQHEQAQHGAS